MDYQRPDPENGPSPSGPRVEDDFVRPLKPMRTASHRRLPAALPFAIAGILVVSSVAFGATFLKNVITPTSSATPGVVIVVDPSGSPAPSISEKPPIVGQDPSVDPSVEAPATPGTLTLTIATVPGKATLTWTAYTGDDFAYYKVVRSDDTTATWPLTGDDKLVAAIDKQGTLTYTDGCGAGTVTYRVFAVKKVGDEYVVVAQSEPKTVTVDPVITPAPPKIDPPAPPAGNPADLGGLNVTDNGNGTDTFSWNAYTGGTAFSYYKLSGVKYPNAPGYAETGQYWNYCNACTSITYKVPSGTWNVNVEAIYYPDGARTALARTSTVKVEGPKAATKTAPPVVQLNLTATVQADGSVQLVWDKYTGPYFNYYAVVRTDGTTEPTLALGTTPKVYFDNQSTTSWIDDGSSPLGKLVPGQTYSYRIYAYSETAFGDVAPACTVVTILAVSNVQTVTIPLAPPPPSSPSTPPSP